MIENLYILIIGINKYVYTLIIEIIEYLHTLIIGMNKYVYTLIIFQIYRATLKKKMPSLPKRKFFGAVLTFTFIGITASVAFIIFCASGMYFHKLKHLETFSLLIFYKSITL